MKVIFSHGKESGPWGSKIKRLAAAAKTCGFDVDSIDYSDILDPDLRVERLINVLREEAGDFILVGSSMGGYVSLVAAEQVQTEGVFLLAPALHLPGYKRQDYHAKTCIEIVHGWSDELIPPENSIRFARSAGCSLHLVPGDHRLNSSIEVVDSLFSLFLASFTRTSSTPGTPST